MLLLPGKAGQGQTSSSYPKQVAICLCMEIANTMFQHHGLHLWVQSFAEFPVVACS
jgi:hypothetical protein